MTRRTTTATLWAMAQTPLERQQKYARNYPGGNRALNLRSRFQMSLEDWDAMFDEQGGKCAMCGRHQSELARTLDVDHDHLTGQVRGLLCIHCNRFLGKYEGLSGQNARAYLARGE